MTDAQIIGIVVAIVAISALIAYGLARLDGDGVPPLPQWWLDELDEEDHP